MITPKPFNSKQFNEVLLHLITDEISKVITRETSLNEFKKFDSQYFYRNDILNEVRQVFYIAIDIFDDIDNHFGFDDYDCLNLNDAQCSLLNETIFQANYLIEKTF